MTYVNDDVREMAANDAADFGDLLYSTYGDWLTCWQVNRIADLLLPFLGDCLQRAWDDGWQDGYDQAYDSEYGTGNP